MVSMNGMSQRSLVAVRRIGLVVWATLMITAVVFGQTTCDRAQGSYSSIQSSLFDENLVSLEPASGELFGAALAAGVLTSGTSGKRDWVLVGVPASAANVSGVWIPQAGVVECFPARSTPMSPPFQITPPAGSAQAGGEFGAALAVGDVDGDGHLDLVVGAPGIDLNGHRNQGRVFVLFGPWDPLASPPYRGGVTILDVHPTDIDPLQPTHGVRFGFSLAVGDLDHAGNLDVVVGGPMANDVSVTPATHEVGAVDIFLDVPKNGGTIYRDQHLYYPPIHREAECHFGWAVAVGNFADPFGQILTDIVAGAPDMDRPVAGGQILINGGIAAVFFGHVSGGQPRWDHSPGFYQEIGGTLYVEFGRQGSVLAAADYSGDGYCDLAVGSPGSLDAGGEPSGPEGFVMMYRGNGTVGLQSDGAMDQPLIFAIPMLADPHNLFGFSLTWSDTSGDQIVDLVIGAPGTPDIWNPSFEAGRVFIAEVDRQVKPCQWALTNVGDPSPNDGQRFGWTTAKSWRWGSNLDDIIVGSPRSDLAEVLEAGEVFVLTH